MHIKSIVLDGFKSYGNRVEINGFDPEFNAITGLNGTGKSNILDAICFVLGISNLTNAGITKATVSITFDNRNKDQCPIGLENNDEFTVTRQIVMGGKNKYLVNGLNVQNKRVTDMFCSVQLNVNNPHFLIMQGRITKVLNMKPPEILSMVEEAAGTRMYETKKQAAEKTIERKDAKLRELNEIIRESIAPKLQKLQDERAQFQEYQKVVRELENLTRLHIAYNYVTAEEQTKEAESKLAQVKDEIKSKQEQIKQNEADVTDFEKQISELSKKVDEESGAALRALEAELSELGAADAGAAADERAARDALQSHSARGRLLARALADDEAAAAAKRRALDQVESTFESLREKHQNSTAVLAEAQQKFLEVSSGLEGASESLQDQLMAAKQEASEAATRISQSEMEKKHAENRLRALEREFDSSSAQFQRDQENIGRHEAQLAELQAELARLGGAARREADLAEAARGLARRERAARDAVDARAPRLARCRLRYKKPEPGFDDKRVYGTICRLIDVVDPIYCTALETAAGGRCPCAAVQRGGGHGGDQQAAPAARGAGAQDHHHPAQQDQRTRHRPRHRAAGAADRTSPRPRYMLGSAPARPDTLCLQGGGPDNVQLALDLVQYPAELRPAMAWVWGGTLVCRDLDTAKRVTFHPSVRRRTVTLDGDVFDPSGTLSGGARVKGGSVLMQLQELKQLEEEHKAIKEQLSQCNEELKSLQQAGEKHTSAQQKFDVMSHELDVIKARLATTSHAQTHEEIQSLRARVQELGAGVARDAAARDLADARARDLSLKLRDLKGHRDREFKKAEEALKKAKKEAELHSNSWKQHEQELETLKLEVSELEKAVAASKLQLADNGAAADLLQRNLAAAAQLHAAASSAVKDMQSRIKSQKAEIASRNTEISRLLQKKEKLRKNNGELELKIQELEYKLNELQTEAAELRAKITNLEKANPWISSERSYFGAPGGIFDFQARQAGAAASRLAQLQARRDGLARGLNARAHTLLGKEEEQYQELLHKKQIVEADRAKLVAVMAELDEKKRKTLVAACEQVNKDFGSIFSTLLPGAEAKLTPPEGQTVLDGLEVKDFNNLKRKRRKASGYSTQGFRRLAGTYVCTQVKVGFNGTWKESLGELSGGQRSLVALSLVLGMLRWQPAPLYVLDEVDAALDLSHTQNIGLMLRTHFRHSQVLSPHPLPPPLPHTDAALDLSHTQNIGLMLRTHFRHSQVLSPTHSLPTPHTDAALDLSHTEHRPHAAHALPPLAGTLPHPLPPHSPHRRRARPSHTQNIGLMLRTHFRHSQVLSPPTPSPLPTQTPRSTSHTQNIGPHAAHALPPLAGTLPTHSLPTPHTDAALDLSHTQNIGLMLRTHFRHSQVLSPHPLPPPLPHTDAALDLSHTQNIGLMLRTHFRHSQVLSPTHPPPLPHTDAALDLSHTQNIGLMLRTHFRHCSYRAHRDCSWADVMERCRENTILASYPTNIYRGVKIVLRVHYKHSSLVG
ncbi:hypothetical protein HF086_003205 [Spodoptera exigua]|uniref:SMC hinge domain-containing protein n=1 Tax=Spodoptera exigua TaxID=7107 RepID=A0A922MFA6_SPOEX|nr:hypothetical protein HF086_003205 [Spodoptera exigua]